MPLLAAEQLVDRYVQRLAEDVVERDVDGALRGEQDAARHPGVIDQVVQTGDEANLAETVVELASNPGSDPAKVI